MNRADDDEQLDLGRDEEVFHDISSSSVAVNPVRVQKFLAEVDYPCSREDLISAASQQGADDDVLQTLQNMPMERFNLPNDVVEAIGKIK